MKRSIITTFFAILCTSLSAQTTFNGMVIDCAGNVIEGKITLYNGGMAKVDGKAYFSSQYKAVMDAAGSEKALGRCSGNNQSATSSSGSPSNSEPDFLSIAKKGFSSLIQQSGQGFLEIVEFSLIDTRSVINKMGNELSYERNRLLVIDMTIEAKDLISKQVPSLRGPKYAWSNFKVDVPKDAIQKANSGGYWDQWENTLMNGNPWLFPAGTQASYQISAPYILTNQGWKFNDDLGFDLNLISVSHQGYDPKNGGLAQAQQENEAAKRANAKKEASEKYEAGMKAYEAGDVTILGKYGVVNVDGIHADTDQKRIIDFLIGSWTGQNRELTLGGNGSWIWKNTKNGNTETGPDWRIYIPEEGTLKLNLTSGLSILMDMSIYRMRDGAGTKEFSVGTRTYRANPNSTAPVATTKSSNRESIFLGTWRMVNFDATITLTPSASQEKGKVWFNSHTKVPSQGLDFTSRAYQDSDELVLLDYKTGKEDSRLRIVDNDTIENFSKKGKYTLKRE